MVCVSCPCLKTIDVRGSQANDVKQSATWGQPKLCDVFLLFFHSLVSFKLVSFYFLLVLIVSYFFDLEFLVLYLKFQFLEILKLEY